MPSPTREPEVQIANILHDIRACTEGIEARDQRLRALEVTVNDLMRRMGRPSGGDGFAHIDEQGPIVSRSASLLRSDNKMLADQANAGISRGEYAGVRCDTGRRRTK